jgi:surfeit locus 1 family protein
MRTHPSLTRDRRGSIRGMVLVFALVTVALLAGLGVWQVQRLAWKTDLIRRVDARLIAAPAAAPGPAEWPRLSGDADAYRRVRVAGVFDHSRETLVMAVTEAGSGFWVMTPMRTPFGYAVLVNRGFVPERLAARKDRAAGLGVGRAEVTGLLRMSEPKGAFLRRNRPDQDRWFSRDVPAIAAARGLGKTAPYFIDADATPAPGGWPRGGLTVVKFSNSHLVYAVTWFSLAGMLAARLAWPVMRPERRA